MMRMKLAHIIPAKSSLFLLTAATIAASCALVKKQPKLAYGNPRDQERGRLAKVPEDIPKRGLLDVLGRVFNEVRNDRVTLIAGGVTFYILLALFPALAVLVSLYGLFADPATMSEHLGKLAVILPPGAFDLVADQLTALTAQKSETLGIAFIVGLAVTLWSSHNGILAIFDAMNVAYNENEKRSLIHLNVVAMGFTICAMIAVAVVIGFVAIVPVLFSYLYLDAYLETAVLIMRWPLLLLGAALAAMAIYRFAPSREPAKIRWLTWGAALTTVSWFVMSLGYSFYMANFANYAKTYGALGALIGFLIWVWLSVTILIVGGTLNAELEHQTALDTTTGPELPMGTRGAYVADTLGEESKLSV